MKGLRKTARYPRARSLTHPMNKKREREEEDLPAMDTGVGRKRKRSLPPLSTLPPTHHEPYCLSVCQKVHIIAVDLTVIEDKTVA